MGMLDLVFPKRCVGCGRGGGYVCADCLAEVARAREKCPECAKHSYKGRTHGSCQRKWGLVGLVSLYRYEGVVRKMILRLKYNFVRDLAEELGEMCSNELKKSGHFGGRGVVLVPVPLYKGRGRWRGFNQSAEVGRVVARKMGWEYQDILVRRRATVSQTGLSREGRKGNVRGAFAITKDSSIVNSSFIYVVFDDVWTTGATMKECAKVLKRKGAGEVWGLSIAA